MASNENLLRVYSGIECAAAALLRAEGFVRTSRSRLGQTLARRFQDGWQLVSFDRDKSVRSDEYRFHVRCALAVDVVRQCLQGNSLVEPKSLDDCVAWISITPLEGGWTWSVSELSDADTVAREIVNQYQDVGDAWFRQNASLAAVRDSLIGCLGEDTPPLGAVIELAIILKVQRDNRFEDARAVLQRMSRSWPTDTAAGIYLAKLDRYDAGRANGS